MRPGLHALETVTPLIAYRCVKCGWDFTEPDAAPSTVAEVLEHWRCIDMNCEGRVERTPVPDEAAFYGDDLPEV